MSSPIKRNYSTHIHRLKEILEKRKMSPAAMVGTILNDWCIQAYPGLTTAELPVKSQLLVDTHVKEILSILKGPVVQLLRVEGLVVESIVALLQKQPRARSFSTLSSPRHREYDQLRTH